MMLIQMTGGEAHSAQRHRRASDAEMLRVRCGTPFDDNELKRAARHCRAQKRQARVREPQRMYHNEEAFERRNRIPKSRSLAAMEAPRVAPVSAT